MRVSTAARPATSWRLITGAGGDSSTARGALNMAVDHALLESVQAGGAPVLRFYTWAPACLSFGRNQPARDLYDPGRAAAVSIDIVRRPTGGLAVLHDQELTYSVAAPLAPFGGPRAAYASINRALVQGLRSLGLDAKQAAGVRSHGPIETSLSPCFQNPAAGEVVARGRKLVGSAQRCERGAFLQHGSILLAGSQSRVLDLLLRPADGPPADIGSITLEDLSGRAPAVPDLIDALKRGFETMFGTRLAPGGLDQSESDRAAALSERYAAGDWTWRR